MTYTYTTINGERVEKHVAAAFQNMRSAFKKKFGLDLLVTSGTRTRAEQQRLYDLYKSGKGNLAAAPGFSNHEESGPRGPRALDLRDSGRDSGVTRKGTKRSNWLKANAPRFGFDPAGFRFSRIEPWHYEFTGSLKSSQIPAFPLKVGHYFGPKAGPVRSVSGFFSHRNDLRRWQQRMKNRGWNIKVDGLYGSQTRRVAKAFQLEKGLRVDGLIGPETWNAAWTAPIT